MININRNKKKNSLLKRTASEPKLSKIESTIDVCKTDGNLEDNKINVKIDKVKYKDKQGMNANKEFYLGEIDSPYNQIFFYNFENILTDYIQNKK